MKRTDDVSVDVKLIDFAPSKNWADGLRALDLADAPALEASGTVYLAELARWNSAYNLTATRNPADMVTRHLLDSLSLLPVLRAHLKGPVSSPLRLLDVGAGAGLPCIPLAMAMPAWQVTGLDSNGKKARFMRHMQRTLGLSNFAVIEARVESVPIADGYDVITSRAFASLGDFFTLTQHLLAPDGHWVAMKGKLTADELAGIPPDVELIETRTLSVPGLNEARHVVIAKKKV